MHSVDVESVTTFSTNQHFLVPIRNISSSKGKCRVLLSACLLTCSFNLYLFSSTIMSTYSSTEIRQLIDDLDDVFWAAILERDIQSVFKRERPALASLFITIHFLLIIYSKQDKLMRIRRETADNAELQRELKVSRYLWIFAEQWHRAKTSNDLDGFWPRVRTYMETFDNKTPNGRRIPPPAPKLNVSHPREMQFIQAVNSPCVAIPEVRQQTTNDG